MSEIRLNSYRIMWVFVFFDLPTETKKNRRDAALFRKNLEKDGYTMMQFSVYMRHCPSKENADVHIKRVKYFLPSQGHVSIVTITDRQYGEILNFNGVKEDSLPTAPRQLELF